MLLNGEPDTLRCASSCTALLLSEPSWLWPPSCSLPVAPRFRPPPPLCLRRRPLAIGTAMACPVRRKSSSASPSSMPISIKAKILSVSLPCRRVNQASGRRRARTRSFRKTRTMSLRCSAITWTISATSLNQISIPERIADRRAAITMARVCRTRCFSAAATRCIRDTSRPTPLPTAASACPREWLNRFSITRRSALPLS